MEEKNMEQDIQGMTAEQVEARIQEAVEQARAEWAQAQAESQRMAAMTEEERAGYEMSRREAELEARGRKLLQRELKAMAVEKLAERGLPRELADALSYDSEAACMKGVDSLERAFRAAVQSAVDERLRGETPAAGANRRADAENLSDADYYRMNTKF